MTKSTVIIFISFFAVLFRLEKKVRGCFELCASLFNLNKFFSYPHRAGLLSSLSWWYLRDSFYSHTNQLNLNCSDLFCLSLHLLAVVQGGRWLKYWCRNRSLGCTIQSVSFSFIHEMWLNDDWCECQFQIWFSTCNRTCSFHFCHSLSSSSQADSYRTLMNSWSLTFTKLIFCGLRYQSELS